MFNAYTTSELHTQANTILSKVERQGEWFPADEEQFALIQEELDIRGA